MFKKRGIVLPIAIGFLGLFAIIVFAGHMIMTSSHQATSSSVKFQIALEASDACLLRAMDVVYAREFCGIRDLTHRDLNIQLSEGASCIARIRQSGRICFIRSTGEYGNSRVHKSAILQTFYGMGLYTVRGGVNANYYGGLLTGCYYQNDGNCFVPAFIISSGTITISGTTPQNCPPTNTNPGSGIYGIPPVFTNAQFRDLTPLFFNVNCFNSNSYRPDERCSYGLTDALRETYALNFQGAPDFYFSQYSEPIVSSAVLSVLSSSDPRTLYCNRTLNTTNSTPLNLSQITTILNATNCTRLEVYVDQHRTITGGPPPIPVTFYVRRGGLTISGINGGVDGENPFGEWIYRTIIYSAQPISISATSSNLRLLTTDTVTATSGIRVINATIIQALTSPTQNNDPASPQNLIVAGGTGSVTIEDSKIFSRQLRFGTLYAWRSLVYVYAYACPNCSRDTDLSSYYACLSDARRCGWAYGTGGGGPNLLNYVYFGTDENGNIFDSNGRPLASLVIIVNSVVAGRRNFYGGIYFGQDINYIVYVPGEPSVVRGFLIRNFPSERSLQITFTSVTDFRFRLDAINSLRFDPNRPGFRGFWFVRRVDCVRELPTPAYMAIITRMTSW